MKRAVIAASAVAAIGVAGLLWAPAFGDLPQDARARGAELAATIGPCGECHSANGAEYAGARVDDWYAPAINAQADARLPWTEEELFTFLRTGSSPLHGIAVGPMSDLVRNELAALPDDDVRALAAYFAELTGAPSEVPVADVAAAMEPAFDFVPTSAQSRGEWLYIGYCVSCHFNRPEAQTAKRPEIALNTAVSAPDPTNLVRVMLRGVTEPEGEPDTYMPGFAMLLSDRDVADIAAYLRVAYASDKDPWDDVAERAAEVRALQDPMR